MNEQTSQQDKDLLQEISKGVEPHGCGLTQSNHLLFAELWLS